MTYSVIFFLELILKPLQLKTGTYLTLVCVLMRQAGSFLKGNFHLQCFLETISLPEKKKKCCRKIQRKKSTNRAKTGMKLSFPKGEEKQPWSGQIFFSMKNTLFSPTTNFQSCWCPQLYERAAPVILCIKLINNSIFPLKEKPFFDGIIYGQPQHQVLFPAKPCFNNLSPSATLLTFSLSFVLGGCSQIWSCTLNVTSKPQSPPCHGLASKSSWKSMEGTEIDRKKILK